MVERERTDREVASRLDRIVAASTLRPAEPVPGTGRLDGTPTPRLRLVLVP
jgi:hypothetical protein